MSTQAERLLAGRQIVAKLVAADVKAVVDGTREQLEPLIGADEGVAAELPDGTRIGTVKRSKPRQTAVITDPDAVLAWVVEHRPDELVQSVKPMFLDLLKERARSHGVAVLADGSIVPGIELRDGTPSYLPQAAPGAAELVRARLAELVGSGLLALPMRREQPRGAA